jgi:hypothetical protein
MTEAEWLACTYTQPMLDFLQGRASDRKLRLVACACCRRIEQLYLNEQRRDLLEVLETWANGMRTAHDVGTAIGAALSGWEPEREREVVLRELIADSLLPFIDNSHSPFELASVVSVCARSAVAFGRIPYAVENLIVEGQQQLLLIRDIFGNPFRPITLDPGWRSSTAVNLAQAAYDERILPSGELEPARLAVLADALEDAGCADASILGHLRGPGPHVRGCWALDLILGKG